MPWLSSHIALKCDCPKRIDHVSSDLEYIARQKDSDLYSRRGWAFSVASVYWKSAMNPSRIKTVGDNKRSMDDQLLS